jgi:hypothetical protein
VTKVRASRFLSPRVLLLQWLAVYDAIGNASVYARDVPAIIVQPTAQSRQALQETVGQALNRESVRLSGDALTLESKLIIEPAHVRDAQGQMIYAREPHTLEHFHLVKSWWRCILIRESTQKRYKLAHTKCQPKT